MKKVKVALSGLILSLPATGMIYLAFYSNREPGSWILIGIVFIMGFPWNLVALAMIALSYLIYVNICGYINFICCIQINPYYLLYLWFSIAGVVGAHVNGALIIDSPKGKKTIKKKISN